MLKVGLTGGYATGKSFVARELARLGAHVIYADQLGHDVLLPGGEAYTAVVAEFGPEILDSDGNIDRKKLADIVFADVSRLSTLNSFVHPAVIHLEQKVMEDIAATDPNSIVVLEAAILIEARRVHAFDKIILTTCDEEVQVARGMHRDNASHEQALARIANQMPPVEKRKYADYVVDTSGTKEETIAQVEKVYRDLVRVAKEAVK